MGRERQQGAIGVMAAATLLLALICLALVIDTGRLYYEQRKLQRVADMAALEAASQSGMCAAPGTDPQAYALASAAKNDFVPATANDLVAKLGSVAFDNQYGGADSRRVFTEGGSIQDSVQVRVSRTVPSSLVLNVASLFSGAKAQTTLSAEAVARRTAMAGLSAGSGVASLQTSASPLLNPLLGGLLGTTLNLDVVTYQGIANTNITLLALSQQLQAAGVNLELGSINSLLNANVTAVQLIQAMINAADASQLAGVDVGLLRTALASINVPGAQLSLAQIIKVMAPGDIADEALNATVNLFDLLMATALVANKNHAVTVPAQTLSIPGLATQTLSLTVISPPTIAIGYPGRDSNGNWRTVAYNAQVQVNVGAEVNLLNMNLVHLKLDLAVTVAPGYAALESIQCAGVGQPVTVTVKAQPGVASAALDAQVWLLGDATGSLVNVVVTNKNTGASGEKTSVGTELAVPGEQSLTFTVNTPDDVPTEPQRVSSPLGASLGTGLTSLANSLKIEVQAGGNCASILSWLLCPLSELVSSIADLALDLTAALGALVNALGEQLVDPLLSLLGIQTGILDVRLIDLQTNGTELLI